MKDKKILDEEILSDEELENVAGGTIDQTWADGKELYKRGLIDAKDMFNCTPIREKIHNMGYNYVDNGGVALFGGKNNEYFNKQGESISREQFWKNFDAENGTKIIR